MNSWISRNLLLTDRPPRTSSREERAPAGTGEFFTTGYMYFPGSDGAAVRAAPTVENRCGIERSRFWHRHFGGSVPACSSPRTSGIGTARRGCRVDRAVKEVVVLVFSNIGANKSIFYHFLAQECFLKDPLPHQENDAGGTPQAPAGDCDGLLYRRPAPGADASHRPKPAPSSSCSLPNATHGFHRRRVFTLRHNCLYGQTVGL